MQDKVMSRDAANCAAPWWRSENDLIAHIEDDMQQLALFSKPESAKQDDEQAVIERHKYGIEVGMRVEAWLRYRANPAMGITGTTIAMQVVPTESHGPDVQFLVRIDEEHYGRIVPDQPYLPYGVSHCCNRPVPLEKWYSGLYLKQVED